MPRRRGRGKPGAALPGDRRGGARYGGAMPTVQVRAPEGEASRLDALLHARVPAVASRSAARRLARAGRVRVEGAPERGNPFVPAGALVEVDLPDGPARPVYPLLLPFLHVDPWMAVVDKPAGLPTSGNRRRTLAAALPANLAPSAEPDALPAPHPVHRLDARTGGLVVVARCAGANVALGRAFQERRVGKRYLALLLGRLEGEGVVDAPLDGRAARTRWRALAWTPSPLAGWITTAEFRPETGRTHQIRRHAAALGHPVLGDDLHGGDRPNLRGRGLFLRAVGLRLEHPVTGEPLRLELPEPPRFARQLRREAARFARGGASAFPSGPPGTILQAPPGEGEVP